MEANYFWVSLNIYIPFEDYMSNTIEKIDIVTLKAIKLQTLYNRTLDSEIRIKIAMNHIEGLKELRRNAVRKQIEKI